MNTASWSNEAVPMNRGGGVIQAWDRPQPVWPWAVVGISLLALMMMLSYMILSPEAAEAWLRFWGFLPAEVMAILSGSPGGWLSLDLSGLVSALLVHASWLHLLGNLAYLWVFGIAVERAIGHLWFLVAFVLLGGAANLMVAWQMAEMNAPVIGASGGVSAIIGVYLGLFPTRRIGLWLPLGLYLQFARIPALLVIGSWFTLQLLYSVFGPISGEVAWWTHVAGFIAGVIAALLLRAFSRRIDLAARED